MLSPHVSKEESRIPDANAPLIRYSQEGSSVLKVYVILIITEEAFDLSVTADGGETGQRLREVGV